MRGAVEAELAEIVATAELAGRRVLEVGCGDGRLTLAIAREAAAVFAIDSDEEAVAEARRGLPADLDERVRFEVADAVGLDVAPQFDLALLSWSL